MSRWTFGDITVDRVLEFEQPLGDPSWLYPTSTPEGVARHAAWLAPDHYDAASRLLVMAFHSFVIRTRHHVIVVDTCSGNDRHRPRKQRYHMKRWPYLERLAAAGVRPEDVDYVLCTHLHVDHVGWNTRLSGGSWIPTFPNARYLFAREEWAYWESHYRTAAFTDDPYYVDCILPVLEAGLVDLVAGDHPIDDGVRLEPTPGHTPGHVCVHVEGGGRRAVMSGDLMHHAIQCAEPDWHSCFCVDPAHSNRMRRVFLDRHAETDTLVMPAHFATPTAGRVVRDGDAWRFAFQDGRR